MFANKKCLCKAYPDRGPNQFNIPANKLVGYESTVGAGTPFISTVKRLMAAGDVPKMIMGTFSGSVNYIFSELAKLTDDKTAGDLDFQKIVMAARAKGFTEPDPRDDLSGTDVQRKVLILARSMGVFGLEMDDIKVTPLYPDSMASLSIPDFMDALATQNDSWKARVQAADKEGKVLRFAAKVEREGYTDDFRGGKIKCSVGVEAVSKDSPLGLLSGTTNIMMIVSDYNSTTQPLVVQGPGAGNQITAAGCLADCVYIADTFNY